MPCAGLAPTHSCTTRWGQEVTSVALMAIFCLSSVAVEGQVLAEAVGPDLKLRH